MFKKRYDSDKKGCSPINNGCTSIVLIVLGIVMMLISTGVSKSTARALDELMKADDISLASTGVVKGTGELRASKPIQAPYGGYCALYNLHGSICYTERNGTDSSDTTTTVYDKPKLGEGLTLTTSTSTIQIDPNVNLDIFGTTRDQGDLETTDEIPPLYPYDFAVAMNSYRSGLLHDQVFRYFKIDLTTFENGSTVFVLGRIENNRLKGLSSTRPMIMSISETDYQGYLEGQQMLSKVFFWIGLFVLLIGIGWLTILLIITVGIAAGGIWLVQRLFNRPPQN